MSDRPKTLDMPADVLSTAVHTSSTPDEILSISTQNSRIKVETSGISIENLDNPAQNSGKLAEKLGILAQEMDMEAERLKILAGYLGISAESLEIVANSLDNPDILRMAVDMSGILRTSGIPNVYNSILVENLNVLSCSLGIIESCLDIVGKTYGIKLDLSIPGDIYGLSVETRVLHFMQRIRISQQRARLLQQATRKSQQIIPVWKSHSFNVRRQCQHISRAMSEISGETKWCIAAEFGYSHIQAKRTITKAGNYRSISIL